MIAAEENRQPVLLQFPINGIVHFMIPGRHLARLR